MGFFSFYFTFTWPTRLCFLCDDFCLCLLEKHHPEVVKADHSSSRVKMLAIHVLYCSRRTTMFKDRLKNDVCVCIYCFSLSQIVEHFHCQADYYYSLAKKICHLVRHGFTAVRAQAWMIPPLEGQEFFVNFLTTCQSSLSSKSSVCLCGPL